MNSDKNGNVKIVIIIVGLFFIAGLWFIFNSLKPENRRESVMNFGSDETSQEAEESSQTPEMVENNPDELITLILEDENTQFTPLENLAGDGGLGKAYLLTTDEPKLYHYVEADLIAPADGQFYEGWLVNPTTNEYFSTGELQVNEEGNYYLLFTSDDLYDGFSKVVITSEQLNDGTPEQHILEGTFN